MRLPPLPSVKDLLKLYRLRALRQLSQNFLLDPRVSRKIVRAGGSIQGAEVCEVGPGPGGITRCIMEAQPSRIVLIEKDRRFLPMLEMLRESTELPIDVVWGDVLSFNLEEIFSKTLTKSWVEEPPNIHLIGNLPFSVSTPLIIRWLRDISLRQNAWRYGRVKMTLTFQKEVAERMVAPVMSKQRCRLSVMVQNWCYVDHKLTIPGSAFIPKPDVDVGVVTFEPLITPVIDLPFPLVEKVARCLFSFRQKHCVKGISTLFPRHLRESLGGKCLDRAEIPHELRPFQLTVPEIGRICFAFSKILQEHPRLESYTYRQSKEAEFEDYEEEEPVKDVVLS